MIWHHISTWVCGLARGHMERRRGLAIVFTLRIQLDCKALLVPLTWVPKLMDCEQRVWSKERNQTITSFNTELVWVGAGCGCGLDRVWIGLDPGLDRPRVDSHVCVCCSLDAAWQEKDDKVCRQQVCSLAAWQAGLTTCNSVSLAVWQLGCATVAAWLLDCLAA